MTVIGFVPARGGSARIPRKNLRTVDGIPLVARTVRMLRSAGCDPVIVSTDDQEIADVASLHGATIDVRPAELCGPSVTIDQVVREWIGRTRLTADDPFDELAVLAGEQVVVVAQPTSPLLLPSTVANAIDYCVAERAAVFSVAPERHMLWTKSTVPLNDVRRNSTDQGEAQFYRETGGVVVFNPFASNVDRWPPQPCVSMEVDPAEAIDIDDYSDLVRARAGRLPARIQLRYVESLALGSGHRRRCEALAVELMGRHTVEVAEHDKAPLPEADLVILDVLDTSRSLIESLRTGGIKHIVTLEDLGTPTIGRHDITTEHPHLPFPDLVINELYRSPQQWATVRSGPRYAVLRPEFQGHAFRPHSYFDADGNAKVTVVVSFGGTDPSGMTEQVVRELCQVEAINELRVVMPPGRDVRLGVPDGIVSGLKLTTVRNPLMAREFLNATLAVTSSGRTVHEAAACGCPVIAVPVNERERMHDVCRGVTYLDIGRLRSNVECALMPENRVAEAQRARQAYDAVDGLGAQRIAWLIDGLLGGMI